MGYDTDFQDPGPDVWEVLSVYLDGALDDVGAAMVERAAHLDPDMAAALADLRRQKAQLKAWAGDIAARPVPAAVRAMIERARAEPCPTGTAAYPGRKHSEP